MSNKVAQTHIHREDGIYFVSTINRKSSAMFANDATYAETMAWGPASTNHLGIAGWPDGRGPLVFQREGVAGSITGHTYVCEMVYKHGNGAADAENRDRDAEDLEMEE